MAVTGSTSRDDREPTRSLGAPTFEELSRLARDAGLARVAVTDAEPLDDTRRTLEQRRAQGLAADMQFTYRNPARSTEPRRILASARSIIVAAWSHERGDVDGAGDGRVASYARQDHYADLATALGAVAERLESAGFVTRIVLDSNALVDRAVAVKAGLGWFGRNANVLLPGAGSWFVLGSIVTDALISPGPQAELEGCGSCRACRQSCPTGAIVADGVIDARRCIAWHVQASGPIPRDHRVAMGARIYGCDDCQEICPPNRGLEIGAGPAAIEPPVPSAQDRLDLVGLATMDDELLLERFGRWYLADRDPRILKRNALVGLGNVGDPSDVAVRRAVREHLTGGDELLQAHAIWAARRLGYTEELERLIPLGPLGSEELLATPPPSRAATKQRP